MKAPDDIWDWLCPLVVILAGLVALYWLWTYATRLAQLIIELGL